MFAVAHKWMIKGEKKKNEIFVKRLSRCLKNIIKIRSANNFNRSNFNKFRVRVIMIW